MRKWLEKYPFRQIKIFKLKVDIYFKYRQYFLLFKKYIKLGEKIIIVWDDQNNFSKLSISMIAITLTRMRSIHVLCKQGFAKNAVILLRVMFEDMINFKYMYNNKSKIQDFIDFDSYQRLRVGRIIELTQEVKIDIEKLQKRQTELKKMWDGVKYRFTYKNGKIFKTWSGKNLEEISRELGHEKTYNFLYRYLSNYVHLTPIILNDYILGVDENGIVVEVGESDKFTREVLASSMILFHELLIKVVNQEYSLRLDKEIESLSKEFKILHEKRNKS